MLDEIGSGAVDEAWRKCEEILKDMSTFSVSAKTTLQLLHATYCQVAQRSSGKLIVPLWFTSRFFFPLFQGHANLNTAFQVNMASVSNRPTNSQHPFSDMGPQFNVSELQEGSREFEQGMQFSNYFPTPDEMGLVSDEFGFLGRFDLPDISSWFSEIPV